MKNQLPDETWTKILALKDQFRPAALHRFSGVDPLELDDIVSEMLEVAIDQTVADLQWIDNTWSFCLWKCVTDVAEKRRRPSRRKTTVVAMPEEEIAIDRLLGAIPNRPFEASVELQDVLASMSRDLRIVCELILNGEGIKVNGTINVARIATILAITRYECMRRISQLRVFFRQFRPIYGAV